MAPLFQQDTHIPSLSKEPRAIWTVQFKDWVHTSRRSVRTCVFFTGAMADFQSFVHRLTATCAFARSYQMGSPEDPVEVDVAAYVDESWALPDTPTSSAYEFDTVQIRRSVSFSTDSEPNYHRPRIGSAMFGTALHRRNKLVSLSSFCSSCSGCQRSSIAQYLNSSTSSVVFPSPICRWQSEDSTTSNTRKATMVSVSSYLTALQSVDLHGRGDEEDQDTCSIHVFPKLPEPCGPGKAELSRKLKFKDPFPKRKSRFFEWVKQIKRKRKMECATDVSPLDSSAMTRANKRHLKSLRKLFPEEYMTESRV